MIFLSSNLNVYYIIYNYIQLIYNIFIYIYIIQYIQLTFRIFKILFFYTINIFKKSLFVICNKN